METSRGLAATALLMLVACGPPSATMVAELPDMVDVGKDAERFALTSANTSVEAEVSAGATFTISFAKASGALEIVVADPTRSQLVQHLRSNDRWSRS
jgi:hypothetical protein